MKDNKKIGAVILAAGFSSRMNNFKPLMQCNKLKMVEIAINLFKTNNINDIIVVTGHNSNRLNQTVNLLGARSVFNPDFKSGMLSSIKKGIKNLRSGTAGFFLLPVDIPAIRPSTVNKILKEFNQNDKRIVIPYFNDQPGHPPLIPYSLKKDIVQLKNGSSLRELLFSERNESFALKVYDSGVLMDADDKNGYDLVCDKIALQQIPDKEECLSIINDILPYKDKIRLHLANVSFNSLKIANALTHKVNADLVIAAGLLHDIMRQEKDHALKGAQFINKLGFKEVADIVAQHMDIEIDKNNTVKEKEIVYFADKICNGTSIDLNYHKRFANNLMKSPWAMTSISRRYENTKLIQTRIEQSAGKSIKKILTD